MRCLLAAVVTSVAAVFAAVDSDINVNLRGVMTRYLRFGTFELADLEQGRVVRHSMETNTAGEIAVVGAIRVGAPKARLLERLRDIVHLKRGPEILQIGRFSVPPVMEDLAALTIEQDDFDPRTCRVGDCSIRLSADLIRRFALDVDTRSPDAQARASAWFKQMLLDNVQAYVSGTAARIAQFDDGDKPIRPGDEFDGLLKNATAVAALVPGLPTHLTGFPAGRVDGAEDFLYWAKEKFGVGPFVTVTHMTIVCPSDHTCVVTAKDVYSSRYVDASLALTVASDAIGSSNAFYLVYANRSRVNALKGFFSALRRTIVERRARGSLETNLRTLKTELEKSP